MLHIYSQLYTLTYLGCWLHDCMLDLLSVHPWKKIMKSTSTIVLNIKSPKTMSSFFTLTIKPGPVVPMSRGRAAWSRPFLLKSVFLLVWFESGRQQSACLVFIVLQECLRLVLRQLDVLQLLQKVTLLLWKTKAHWRQRGRQNWRGITDIICDVQAAIDPLIWLTAVKC